MILRDFITLTKPRITCVVLGTSSVGMALAPGALSVAKKALSLAGIVLVVSAANALNMWWERDLDGRMDRTKQRPIPAGRLDPSVALVFGLLLGVLAVPMLFFVNALSGALGLFALVSYVAVYTPLKRHTPLALQVGAIPGAIPPLLGWTCVSGRLDGGGLALFAILFLWQIPHFIAISLFRSEDYARAGLKVYGVVKSVPSITKTAFAYTVVLVAATLIPYTSGMAGKSYLLTTLLGGVVFGAMSLSGLRTSRSDKWARSLFGYSILYLVVVFGVLVADRVQA